MRTVHRLAGLALALGLSTPAHAARHELSFQFVGVKYASDDMESAFRDEGTGAFGLRAGYAVIRNKVPGDLARYKRFGLVVGAGWAHGVNSTSLEADVDGPQATNSVAFALNTENITVGAKVDVDIANVLYPYVRLDIGLIAGLARADGNTRVDDNDTFIRDSAFAPAGSLTAGFELMIPDRKLQWPVSAALTFEGGYQLAGGLAFNTFGGNLNLSGAMFRGGIGLRW